MTWNRTQSGRVAIVAVKRPPENLMTFAALRELDELLVAVGDDENVAAVVITSDVPGRFVGRADRADLDRFARGQTDVDAFELWLSTLLRLESLPQPTLAAIDGPAWGGGCEVALACTFRVGSRTAEFCQMEITKGVIPGGGATQRLPRLIGPARAARMILTGRVVGADEALAIGLLDEVLEAPDFRQAAVAWAQEFAGMPRNALVAAKRAMAEGRELSYLEALENEQRLFLEVFASNPKEC
jgi:enoyl-CoA hydratase